MAARDMSKRAEAGKVGQPPKNKSAIVYPGWLLGCWLLMNKTSAVHFRRAYTGPA